MINDLVELFGPARSVAAMSSRLLTERPTPDTGQLAIEFANGALANVFASFCVEDGDPYRNTLVLNFERGTIYRNAGPARSTNESELSLVSLQDGQRKIVASDHCTPSGLYQWDAFYRAICNGPLPHTISPSQVADAIRIMTAMAKADQSGQRTTVQ